MFYCLEYSKHSTVLKVLSVLLSLCPGGNRLHGVQRRPSFPQLSALPEPRRAEPVPAGHLVCGSGGAGLRFVRALYSTPYILHPTFYTSHSTPHILHPTFYTSHSTPHILHLTFYTRHSTPHILHLTFYTLHSTPHILHPTFYTLPSM